MEVPKCPKCENPFFVLQELTPVNQQGPGIVRIEVLLCSQCNIIIGTTGRYGASDFIIEHLNRMSQQVQVTHDVVLAIRSKLFFQT